MKATNFVWKGKTYNVGDTIYILNNQSDILPYKLLSFDTQDKLLHCQLVGTTKTYDFDFSWIYDFSMLGSKELVEGGTIYYPEQTENGFCFRDEEAIYTHKGIAYIAECVFVERPDYDAKSGILITDAELNKLIEEGGVETYESFNKYIYMDIKEKLDDTNETYTQDKLDKFVDFITTHCLCSVDWLCPSTYYSQLDIMDLWEYFLEKSR